MVSAASSGPKKLSLPLKSSSRDCWTINCWYRWMKVGHRRGRRKAFAQGAVDFAGPGGSEGGPGAPEADDAVRAHAAGVCAAGGDDEEPRTADDAGARAGTRVCLHTRQRWPLDAKQTRGADNQSIGISTTSLLDDRFFLSRDGISDSVRACCWAMLQRFFEGGKDTEGALRSSHDVAEQLEATSKDGTKVPYFVVHRKDIPMDGARRHC